MKEYIMIKETGNAPITVAELVRCKYCRFWQSRVYRIIDGNTHHLCEMTKGYRKPDWFCADGERK